MDFSKNRFIAFVACTLAAFFSDMTVSDLKGSSLERSVPLRKGVSGIWNDGSKEAASDSDWVGRWIWVKEADERAPMLARRTFDLESVRGQARLRVSASSLYELYVNGSYVARGPARSAPHHQSYDEFELSSLLRKGTNVIAARVLFQEGSVSYHHAARPGFLLQLDIGSEGNGVSIGSGASWKVATDEAWSVDSPLMSRFHLERSDRVDLRKGIRHWMEVDFDDSSWEQAVVLHRSVGWPSFQANDPGSAITSPWTALYQRDIPYLVESERSATRLIQVSSLSSDRKEEVYTYPIDETIDARLVEERGIAGGYVVKPAGDEGGVWLLFDMGKVVNGLPYLEIEGEAGMEVEVMSAPFVVDDTFTSNIVDSRLSDQLALSGGEDRWRAAYFKPVRYLGLRLSGMKNPVAIKDLGVHELAYPFSQVGGFHSPDAPWFEACWNAALKTIETCTTDAYTDNYRERRQYVQTAYYAALGNYWSFGDTALMRRCLRQAAEEQEANGLMPAYAPRHGDDFMVILDSNTAWLRALHDYYLYSGDEDAVRELLPAADRLMSFFETYVDERGLLNQLPYSYWIDHAELDRRGANFCINAHYLGALGDYAALLDWLGEGEASRFKKAADRLRVSMSQRFWNAERGLFCDAVTGDEQSKMFSEHSNGMALALGVATPEQGRVVAAELLGGDAEELARRASGLTVVTPAVSYLMHLGLARYGHAEESLALFRERFARMLDPDTNETLWEEWWRNGTGRTGTVVMGRTRSDAQTESAFPPALFGETLLGLQPKAPGLKRVSLGWPLVEIGRVSGTLPSPRGTLSVDWDIEEGSLELEVPEGMTVQLDTRSFRGVGRSLASVNGRRFDPNVVSQAYIEFSAGSYGIRF